MFRKITALSAQMSITQGKEFNGKFSDELEKMKFPSKYWVNDTTLRKIGVAVKAAEKNKGVTLKKAGILYNASQTTDPKRVESFYGSFSPKFLLSQSPIKNSEGKLMPSSGRSEWISKEALQKLNLKVKPGSKPVQYKIADKSQELYFLDQIEGKDKLKKAVDLNHRSASSGIPYRMKYIPTLVKAAIEKGYTSGLWVSPQRLTKLQINVKPKESPIKLGDYALYNVQQSSNPQKATENAEKSWKHISAVSGKAFPQTIGDQFTIHLKKMTGKAYPIWMTASRAIGEKLVNSGVEAVVIYNEGKKIPYFNVADLKFPAKFVADALSKRLQLKKSQYTN